MYARLCYVNGEQKEIPLRKEERGNDTLLSLSKEAIGAGVRQVDIHMDAFTARAGDEGYFVIPGSAADGTLLTRFTPREDTEYAPDFTQMTFLGRNFGTDGLLVIAEGMRFDFTVTVGVRQGLYYAYPRYLLDGDEPREDITLVQTPLADGGYSAMARCYREYKMRNCGLTPLRERVNSNPALKQAAECPEIRIRQGWKPAPSPIEYQRPENEPPMHVACTFERVKDILKAFQKKGLVTGEFCLVGWNIGGHDGRFPQNFPADPRLGGEEGLRDLIKAASDANYLITCHTSSTAAYTIADCWDTEYLVKRKDGSLLLRPYCWGGGRPHKICPKRQYERFDSSDLPALKRLGFRGIHYIDVMTILPLVKCYDEKHPLTRRETAEWYRKSMRLCKRTIGGFGSEGSYDFAAEEQDYCMYAAFHVLDGKYPGICDEPIPFWELVYHGSILYNPCTDALNYAAKGPANRLKYFEYGGRPLIVYYANFASGHNWMGKEDFICDTDAQLQDSVEKIAVMYADYEALANVRYEFMDAHEKLSGGVYRVTYHNGTTVTTDYTKNTVSICHAGGKRQLIQC